ncbi:uncharacterized protein LOC120359650 [Solenopsis invicta]|uniref:uncharacterized protein LOC120359650 n=1 Tax=Solenopsis invicta TaxID=13686 RepID=UPI00193E81E0|nr:uncharacterized protein LOC120359650 [Solenopsis invicta]
MIDDVLLLVLLVLLVLLFTIAYKRITGFHPKNQVYQKVCNHSKEHPRKRITIVHDQDRRSLESDSKSEKSNKSADAAVTTISTATTAVAAVAAVAVVTACALRLTQNPRKK